MKLDVLILLLNIFLPFAVAVLLLLIPKKVRWLHELLTLLTTLFCVAAALRFLLFASQAKFTMLLFSIGNFELAFDIGLNSLNTFMLLFATGFAFLIAMYSLKYMAAKEKRKQYYVFLLTTLGGASGVLVSNHLLVLLIFWEVVSVSLYFLITTGGKGSRAGATKTMAMIGAADGCLLLGIGFLWYLSQLLYLDAITITINNWLSILCFILMMIGAITKAGAMPFHSWIPKASEKAPASVMALLPASIDKLIGIYLLFILCTKIFVLPQGLLLTLMIIGVITIVAAVMMALVQHKLPHLLSYHAISQVGYMVLGIGTGVPLGIAGGLFHMLNHSIYKSCLFLCAGAVEHKTGTVELEKLGGLSKTMPVTFITCLIAALSISGVPLFNGFVSKWMIYQGMLSGQNAYLLIFLIAAMFGSALTLASFIKVIYSVFLGRTSTVTKKVKKDVGITMQIPMLVLALLCVLFGVWYSLPLNEFIYPATQTTPVPIGSWDSILAIILSGGGLIIGLFIYMAGRIKKKARVGETFIGGEVLKAEDIRVPGTEFYNSIQSMKPFKGIYNIQNKGALDPYNWFGRLGLAFSSILKKIHNGILPFYVFWTLLGMGVLILLFIL
ncbi:MAG: NADH-quinone oxidoreductase subunit L [Spirochaetales bacterium]|nr:NADH-quinone oxidoreductase subunit L [Spirochaetales bacterium]